MLPLGSAAKPLPDIMPIKILLPVSVFWPAWRPIIIFSEPLAPSPARVPMAVVWLPKAMACWPMAMAPRPGVELLFTILVGTPGAFCKTEPILAPVLARSPKANEPATVALAVLPTATALAPAAFAATPAASALAPLAPSLL